MRIDRLQQGLYLALAGLGASVIWTHAHVAREDLGDDLLTLAVLTGPTDVHRPHPHGGETLLPATSAVVTVAAVEPGDRLVARVNDYDYRHDVEFGETKTTIRDDLIAQIAAGEADALDVVAAGTDGLALAPQWLGALRALSVSGSLSVSGVARAADAVQVSDATVTAAVVLEAYSRGREPRDGATALLRRALEWLRRLDAQEILERHGLAIWAYGVPVDLSVIVGAEWETRASVDLTVAARSVSIEPVDAIEHVTVGVTLETAPGEGNPATGSAVADIGA